ncbi:hypothetical protein HN51_055115, partial [Arachis hypogaea]
CLRKSEALLLFYASWIAISCVSVSMWDDRTLRTWWELAEWVGTLISKRSSLHLLFGVKVAQM